MIKVKDIAFVRFSAPDLEQMERFLLDFGLMVTARENDVIYARRTDPSPYLHVTERGEHGFRGVAFASPIPTVTPSRWPTRCCQPGPDREHISGHSLEIFSLKDVPCRSSSDFDPSSPSPAGKAAAPTPR